MSLGILVLLSQNALAQKHILCLWFLLVLFSPNALTHGPYQHAVNAFVSTFFYILKKLETSLYNEYFKIRRLQSGPECKIYQNT